MGIPTPGVISGYTNGTITTYDYSIELGTIATELAAMNTWLAAMSVWMGPQGALVPGSMANSLLSSSKMLIQLAGGTDSLTNKSDQTAMLIKGMHGSIDAMAKAIHEQAAIQTLQAADQIEHNSFQKQATLDALKRNDLPAPVPPKPMDEIKAKIKNAEIIHAEALLTGTVSSITDNALSTVKDYIMTSGPIVYAQEVIGEAFSKIGTAIENTIKDFLPASLFKTNKKIQRNVCEAGVPAANPTVE